jgi:hypothetical protein
MPRHRSTTACLFAYVLLGSLAATTRAVAPEPTGSIPLERGHAHNDYLHERPLLDALDHGFCSIEADVWVSNDELLVAHTMVEIRAGRTLESLYLKPLAERVAPRGGWVYGPGRTVMLLIDFKSDGQATYPVLARQLEKYRQLFTPRDPGDGRLATAPVLAVISGDRPIDMIAADAKRLCGIDGRLSDIGSDQSTALMPLISDAWPSQFTWQGAGAMPEVERTKLRRLVEKTHQSGRRLRFWGAPDNEAMWSELYEAGVDLLNADDLPRLRRFLLSRQR